MPRPLRLVERLPRAETGKLPRQSLLQFFAQTCRQAG
jgi:acyl-coenzyme A synthetase/AMP-(fatty) acid ligase